ncbi:putative peroxidase [Helianthus debilis subsp. tardiflorus]
MNPFTITTMEIYTIKASSVFHFSTSYTIKASIFYHSRVLCSSLLPISHLCIQNLRSSSIFRSGKVNVWFRDGFWPGERWRWHNFNAGTVCVAIWVKECVLKWLFYRRTLPTRFGKHRGFAFVEYVNQTRDEKRPSSSLYQTLIFMDTIRLKSLLEAECPGIVSCADIGGPSWKVPTGRRDGVISVASESLAEIPAPFNNITTLIQNFANKSLDIKDLVLLSGSHTIGISLYTSFSNRPYNLTGVGDQDPTLDSEYAANLKSRKMQDTKRQYNNS